MYARQLAWYHSRGKKQDKTRGEIIGKHARFPKIEGLEYIFELALEVGLYDSTWSDVEGWARVTGTRLSPWEAIAIKRISNSYTMGIRQFDGNDALQPWNEIDPNDKATIAEATKKALRR